MANFRRVLNRGEVVMTYEPPAIKVRHKTKGVLMKAYMAKVEISMVLENLSPAEAGEIAAILEDLHGVKDQWGNTAYTAVSLVFNNIEAYQEFIRRAPLTEWAY